MITSEATREELIELANKFLNAETEEESESLYHEFNTHFSHPDTANLFFWPENYNARRDQPQISEYEPTVEEVVDQGISHKPIIIIPEPNQNHNQSGDDNSE